MENLKLNLKIRRSGFGKPGFREIPELLSCFIFMFSFLIFNFISLISSHASGVAAPRQTGSGTQQRPTLRGPNIDLGRQRTQGYIPPRTKSVNLPPVIPGEHVEEPPKPKPSAPKKVAPSTPSRVLTSSSQSRNAGGVAASQPPKSRAPADTTAPNEELTALFSRLDQSSELWLNISDMRVKGLIVSRYVDLYGQFGVKISKPAVYYVNLIDAMAQNNPQLLTQPFDQVLRIVAILEYDYNSGEDKDALARSILGTPQAVANNKKRLGIK